MDEDNFRRGPATSHQLEPVDDENVSKKARVARNVLHIRGEDSMKFDVNEKAWPNADLVFRATCEGAFIDSLPAEKVRNPCTRKNLQKHKEREEKLPQPDQLIKICTVAGFLKAVEVGQCFMTKHTDEF